MTPQPTKTSSIKVEIRKTLSNNSGIHQNQEINHQNKERNQFKENIDANLSPLMKETNIDSFECSLSDKSFESENDIMENSKNKKNEQIASPKDINFNRVTYRIERSSARSMTGKKKHFLFLQNSLPLFNVKLKSKKHLNRIEIYKGPKTEGKKDLAGILLICNSNATYSLRRGNSIGDDLMTIKFFNRMNERKRRNCSIFFFGKDLQFENSLESRKSRNDDIDFGNRHVIQSDMNLIIEDSKGNEMIAVMKAASHSLMIDTIDQIDKVCIFAIGIASFLNSLNLNA